jgi:hypothetical protein
MQPRREMTVFLSPFGLESVFMIGRSDALMVRLYSSDGSEEVLLGADSAQGGGHLWQPPAELPAGRGARARGGRRLRTHFRKEVRIALP